ncbi:hypothetical protein [Nocardiopsis sp. HUAS JQ3]|uniref:hypothetical protein n=1 Tax=Nocardiopsis sp. HUAS JQ3 TaxID=3061629 RepID=UPI0023A9F4B0|nr:hypothetical protein [Nocardiopsis sp. HUAS JQ3]WDZ91156.1 hypothetical protein PV789_00840 [Nocardiopsis sp. HUAS JQ3]
MRYVVRERTLPARLAAARPSLTVWDVTEEHTARPVPYGVHTTWTRAHAHATRLRAQAVEELAETAHAEEAERTADRVRIAARERQEEETPRPRPRRGRRGRRRRPTALPPRTSPWDGSLDDAADIIARVRAAGGAAAYTCVNPAECWRQGGHAPHAIRVTAPTTATLLPGDVPPQTVRR